MQQRPNPTMPCLPQSGPESTAGHPGIHGLSPPEVSVFSWLWSRFLVCWGLNQLMSCYDNLKFDAAGLIPAIIQDAATGRVLMMAWMNRASLEKTIETGKTHFWSRSRQKFWMKGESSGHTQAVKDIAFDCDGDTLLIQVEQKGAACHEGYRSCFFRSITGVDAAPKVTEPRLVNPEEVYGKA